MSTFVVESRRAYFSLSRMNWLSRSLILSRHSPLRRSLSCSSSSVEKRGDIAREFDVIVDFEFHDFKTNSRNSYYLSVNRNLEILRDESCFKYAIFKDDTPS